MTKIARSWAISALTTVTCLAFGGTAQAATVEIEAKDNKFAPVDGTAAVGDTIVFKNTGKSVHNAKSKDGAIDIALINAGQEQSVVIKKAGTIEYVCTFHEAAGMKGKLTLAEASGAAPGAAAGPTPSASPTEKESEAKDVTEKKKLAAEEPPPEAPPSQKYFPPIAAALLALLAGIIALSYRKNMAAPAAAAPVKTEAAEPASSGKAESKDEGAASEPATPQKAESKEEGAASEPATPQKAESKEEAPAAEE